MNLDSKLSITFQNFLLIFNITVDCDESFYLICNNKKTYWFEVCDCSLPNCT